MDTIAQCPLCQSELEATAIVYLSNVVLDAHGNVESYDIAYHLGDNPDGVVVTEKLEIYCARSCSEQAILTALGRGKT